MSKCKAPAFPIKIAKQIWGENAKTENSDEGLLDEVFLVLEWAKKPTIYSKTNNRDVANFFFHYDIKSQVLLLIHSWFTLRNNPKYKYFLNEISIIYENPQIMLFYEKLQK